MNRASRRLRLAPSPRFPLGAALLYTFARGTKTMDRRLAVCCSTALLVMLAGCSGSTPAANTAADIKAIKDNEAQWNKDFEAKDAAKLAAHYTEDAILMNPGMPASKGMGAIRQALAKIVADPAFSLKFQADNVEVAKSGDLAYSQGTYTMTMTDPATKKPVTDTGSYVTVYRKDAGGSWKAVQDAAISAAPPVAPTAKTASEPKNRPAKKKVVHKKK